MVSVETRLVKLHLQHSGDLFDNNRVEKKHKGFLVSKSVLVSSTFSTLDLDEFCAYLHHTRVSD